MRNLVFYFLFSVSVISVMIISYIAGWLIRFEKLVVEGG